MQLALVPNTDTFPTADSVERPDRTAWRFVIDGRPLRDGELLVWFRVPLERPTFKSGRTTITTCGLCGHEGCGALAALVAQVGDEVVWSDFAYETPHDEPTALDIAETRFPRSDDESVMRLLPRPAATWA
ncbi:MAG: hypothetical protein V4510_07180 [bacterium]